MTDFKIEVRGGVGNNLRKVGVHVTAKAYGYTGPSANVVLSGALEPVVARAVAAALLEQAQKVEAKQRKEDAEDARRSARLAKLPQVSFR